MTSRTVPTRAASSCARVGRQGSSGRLTDVGPLMAAHHTSAVHVDPPPNGERQRVLLTLRREKASSRRSVMTAFAGVSCKTPLDRLEHFQEAVAVLEIRQDAFHALCFQFLRMILVC